MDHATLARRLMHAVVHSPADAVVQCGESISVDDVRRLDATAASLWAVALNLAADGVAPTASELRFGLGRAVAEGRMADPGERAARAIGDLIDAPGGLPLRAAARDLLAASYREAVESSGAARANAVSGGAAIDDLRILEARERGRLAGLEARLDRLDGNDAEAGTFTGAELDAMELPPLRYVVDGLIPEGLTMLAGAPKLGKSWLVLAIALAVAVGGRALGCIPVRRSPVLYLALEDGERRLQSRSRTLLGPGEPIPSGITFRTVGTHAEHELYIRRWLARHRDDAPLVVIDTLGRYRPPVKGRGGYDDDYHFMASVKGLVDPIPSSAMLLVHHTRKSGSGDGGDWLDASNGTNGMSGAVDAALILARRRGESGALLGATGRDITRETVYALTTSGGAWTLDGGGLDAAANAARVAADAAAKRPVGDATGAVVALVEARFLRGEVTTAADVATTVDAFHGDPKTAGNYLARAADSGRIRRVRRGEYTAVGAESGESDE